MNTNPEQAPLPWHTEGALVRMLAHFTLQREVAGQWADRIAQELHTRGVIEELPQRLHEQA